MIEELHPVPIHGFAAQNLDSAVLARALVTFLQLTSDAVLAFGSDGHIMLANSEAERLFRTCEGGLVGADVRKLFPPAIASDDSDDFEASVPFSLDGTTTALVCERANGDHIRVNVRCESMRGYDELYVLVGFASDAHVAEEQEHARLVEELSRANRRLSGTLRVVLETLDSLDVGMLFDRVLDEISDTLDAWATLAYVAENDGYRLRGGAEALGKSRAPMFFSASHPFAELMEREGRCLRLRVLRPTRDDLRKGVLTERQVIEEDSLQTITVAAGDVAPFASLVMCPVWFGGTTIALLVVGWKHEHSVADDDIRLLDAVAEYLSVQLAGAFAAMRAQHAEHLESLASQLRERLMAGDGNMEAALDETFALAAQGVEAQHVKLAGNAHQRTTVAKIADGTWQSIPVDLASLAGAQEAALLDVAPMDSLLRWLHEFGLPEQGVLAIIPTPEDSCRGYLVLRPEDSGPFEDVDLSFLQRFVEDVRAVGEGARARTRDKRIAQALQWGMRNELQRVDGISTESCYCSATETAYVGGDFYDLIRLPERRACVVMGDVSGKGVEAASVASAVKTAIGAYAWEGVGPARMVSLLNDFLLGFSKVETFATMFVGLVDLSEKTLVYCSAGHPPALLARAETGELITLEVQSGVVGAFGDMRYTDGEIEIDEGDVLLLYTDGSTEARSPQGSFFGEDGLREAAALEVACGFEGVCDRILEDVESFAGGTLGDDVALVALRFDV